MECQGLTQYFPDMAIRLLNVFLSKIQCPHIVSHVTKRIGHCVLALWSIWEKVKFKLHLIRWILLSWFEEGLLVGPGGRDGTKAWISAGSSSSCLRKKSHTDSILIPANGFGWRGQIKIQLFAYIVSYAVVTDGFWVWQAYVCFNVAPTYVIKQLFSSAFFLILAVFCYGS